MESDPIGLGGGLNTYGYAFQRPTMLDDPFGLVPPGIVDLTKLWDWINPPPLSPEECSALRDRIQRNHTKLKNEIAKYDPILDAQGGFPMPYGSEVTKPGGHYFEILDLQRGQKRDLKKYNKRCRCGGDDDPPPITRNVDALANREIPIPPVGFYVVPIISPGLVPFPGPVPGGILSPAP